MNGAFELRWTCLAFLNNLMVMKSDAQARDNRSYIENARNKVNGSDLVPDIDDIKLISTLSLEKRDLVFRSEVYTGYKLLWIIGKLIQGESLDLTNEEHKPSAQAHRAIVYAIGNFLKEEKNVTVLLSFDAQEFFKTISGLFLPGKAWEYLSQWEHHQYDWNLHGNKTVLNKPEDLVLLIHNQAVKISDKNYDPYENLINKGRAEIVTKTLAEKKALGEKNCKDYYYQFVLSIQHGCMLSEKDLANWKEGDQRPMLMEKDLVVDAIKRVLVLQ